MGLLSFFKRSSATPAAKPVSDTQDAVQALRIRARRRLIGAALLVGVGVIGFPLLFETQPRPIPVDLPIEIPKKEGAPALVIPPALPANLPAPAGHAEVPPPAEPVVEKTADKAVAAMAEKAADNPLPRAEKPTEKAADRVAEKAAAKPAERSADKAPEKTPEKPAAEGSRQKPQSTQEAARVQALLEDKPAEKKGVADAGRFIVQVGAYADNKAAHEARMKVERMGLKTYTQAVETADGKRIRVRVGPFASREEADKVAAKVRGGGLSTAVLTL